MLKLYEIVVVFKAGILRKKNSFEMTKVKIVAENERYLIINDMHLSKYYKKNEKDNILYPSLERISISINTNDRLYGTSVRYSLLTNKIKKCEKIKQEIEAAINDKIGDFCKPDLSFIDDRAEA